MQRNSFTRLTVLKKCRGQVSILFALLMPIFLMMVGVVLDLGWYYLNVSRLQNAADAAAVAGAQTLIDNENFSDYKSVTLTSKYPGKVSNQYRSADNAKMEVVENISDIAKKYIAKNLSSREGNIINSWTKEKVETETPALYEKGDNLYFVVQLREEVRHFFLPGWFENMSAPVTAVALITKSVSNNEPSTPEMPSTPETPSTPVMPTGPPQPTTAVPKTLVTSFGDVENDKIIVGNWEVQKVYKQQTKDKNGVYVHTNEANYAKNFGRTRSGKPRTIYDHAWNHFQDYYNRYAAGGLYRTQTIIVEDDVIAKLGERDPDNKNNVLRYGESSSVTATAATVNENFKSTAYNTQIYARATYKSGITESKEVGLPYTSDRLDSINIDFRPEIKFKGKWLKEDWDITLGWDSDIEGYSNANNKNNWANSGTLEADIRLLRIHSSINFNGAYIARDASYREKDAGENLLPDVLWTRIESEPMLYHPDVVRDDATYTAKVTIDTLNSVNQIIINANDSNIDENYRPVVIFYNGPETNDVYSAYKSRTDVLHRKSLPVILNLNVPFRLILYAPNSPVVVIGDAKNELQGFVVAKKYMRLKDDSDFVKVGQKMWLGSKREVYYAIDDTKQTKPCYKTIDENGIDMFVDEHGDIQFADYNDAPKRCGTFDNFGRTEFSTEDFKVPSMKNYAANMLVYVPEE